MGAEDLSALIIAAVAFVLAVLQQYAVSATTLNKVNHAAIGEWSSMNRHWWSWQYWQFKVEYVDPSIDVSKVMICIGLEKRFIVSRVRKIVVEKCPHLESANFAFNSRVGEGAQGARLTQTPRVIIDHRYIEDIPEIPAKTRRAHDCEKALASLGSRESHAKATWLNLMAQFLGGKIQILFPDSKDRVYQDADTIPTSFDNPCMHIFASALVTLGLLLDMAIIDIDLNGNRFEMAGLFCSLSGADRFGHGLMIAYSGKPGHHHRVLGCTIPELRSLTCFARGGLFIGDVQLPPFICLGYNSTLALIDRVLENLWSAVQPSDGDPSPFLGTALPRQWFETSVKRSSGDDSDDEETANHVIDEIPDIDDPDLPMSDLLEADSHPQWRGHCKFQWLGLLTGASTNSSGAGIFSSAGLLQPYASRAAPVSSAHSRGHRRLSPTPNNFPPGSCIYPTQLLPLLTVVDFIADSSSAFLTTFLSVTAVLFVKQHFMGISGTTSSLVSSLISPRITPAIGT
ncbi:hypothetical protein C8J56DRAFT_1163902 [Mycena floridula]|nr:hypothetical protein C8J56DRAFT_1163902 [Mycena floridula]